MTSNTFLSEESTFAPNRRTLSIQSHVTYGHVGTTTATLPLNLLQHDVSPIHTAILSNHLAYPNGATSTPLPSTHISTIISGLDRNNLLPRITHLLTGYASNADTLNAIADAVPLLRRRAAHRLVFVCDPVLGDDGRLYVPRDMVRVYIERVIALADIITPNFFELSVLTNRTITSEHAAFAACQALHQQHNIPLIFVTGCRLPVDDDDDDANPSKSVSILISAYNPNDTTTPITRHAVDAKLLPTKFSGTGDLLAALLLAWCDKFPNDAPRACAHAMASVSAVLATTSSYYTAEVMVADTAVEGNEKGRDVNGNNDGDGDNGDGERETFPNCAMRELRLVQSQRDIVNPPLQLVSIRQVDIRIESES